MVLGGLIMVKSKSKIKSEIIEKKKLIEYPQYGGGTLDKLQNAIKDIYEKLNDINERI